MAIDSWNPPQACTPQEERMLSRMKRTGKLFAFLRRHRHQLFDEGFQQELASMYRDTGAGQEPKAPALMAMAMLLQGYAGTSDAETVEMTLVELRWQMVLDCLGSQEPAFSQGAFQAFRQRMIQHDMDRRLLERTVELARQSGEFDHRKLPKTLRVAIDSSPLEGAGRVEDTLNLLGHAARKVVLMVAMLLGWDFERVCREAGIPLLLESSIKKGLDLDWDAPGAKAEALSSLLKQLDALEVFLQEYLPEELEQSPLRGKVKMLERLKAQDLEPVPEGGGKMRIREGVAPDRQISIEDPEMRHGRKSKTHRIDGYKRHVVSELDETLILACAITPANQPEAQAVPSLQSDLERQGVPIGELYIDRGYLSSPLVPQVLAGGGEVICRPWPVSNDNGLFSKNDFQIDVEQQTITCPGGQRQSYQRPGQVVQFDGQRCESCALRPKCTRAAVGRGRTVTIAEDEALQQQLRRQAGTKEGRARLRQRTAVEHRLAHVVRRQGRRARYRGVRKNLFDLRRASALHNLETIDRREQAIAQQRKAA